MAEEWSIEWKGILNRSQYKRLDKHYPDEVASCLGNLELVYNELSAGKPLGAISFGFFRSERRGVYRIGQTRIRSSHELRLYVFPDEQKRQLWILCLGDKSTQQDDIRRCHQQADTLKGN